MRAAAAETFWLDCLPSSMGAGSPSRALRVSFSALPGCSRRSSAALALPVQGPAAPTVTADERLAEIVALLRDGQRETAETKAMIQSLESRIPPGPGIGFSGATTAQAEADTPRVYPSPTARMFEAIHGKMQQPPESR